MDETEDLIARFPDLFDWRRFVDARTNLFLVHDSGFRLIFANRAFFARTGADPRQALGRPYHDILVPEEGGPFEASRTVLSTGKESEGSVRTRDGRSYRIQALPSKIPEGGAIAVVLVLEDVTEKKRRESSLREILEMKDAVVDQTLGHLERSVDIDPLIEGILRGAMDLTGADGALVALYDAEKNRLAFRWRFGLFKAMDDRWNAPFPADQGAAGAALWKDEGIIVRDYDRFPSPLPAFLSLGLKCGAIVPFVYSGTKRGVLALVSSSDRTLFAKEHLPMVRTIARSTGLALERHELIETVSAERRKFLEIVDTVPEILFVYSFEKDALTFVSPAIREFGLSPEELLQSGSGAFGGLFDEAARETARAAVQAALGEGRETLSFDLRATLTGGASRHFTVRATIRKDAAGLPSELFGAARDISKRVRLEEENRLAAMEMETLIEALPDGVWLKDARGAWRLVNRAGLSLFGLVGRTDWIGKTEQEMALLNPLLADAHLGCLVADERAWSRGVSTDAVEPVTTPDGALHIIETRKIPLFNEDGTRKALVVVGRDATERLRSEEERALAELVFRASPFGITITDAENRILRVNPAFSAITGYAPEEVLGKDPRVFASGRHDTEFYRVMWKEIRTRGVWEGEIWDRRKNGEIYPQWLSVVVLKEGDRIKNHIGIFFDIGERKAAEERLRYLATTDPLTGLPNRQAFMRRLERTLFGDRRSRVAVLLVDLDRFKTINDTLGHALGDGILKEAGARLSEILRAESLVARLGGDEFVLALPGGGPDGIESATLALIERIRKALHLPFAADGRTIQLGASIGVSLFPDDGTTAEELLRTAEIALYQAKEGGRGTFRFFDPAQDRAVQELLLTEQEMLKGLESGQFFLHYQPVVDSSGRLRSVEALARWVHPEWGTVPPSRFIPVAEKTGLILPLGRAIMKMACRQAREWADAGRPRRVAINVSPRQFHEEEFCESVIGILEETGVPPSLVVLEITESLLLVPDAGIANSFETLKQRGIHFSLDDFGTGYSSLRSLRDFPIDTIKIDQSFIRNLEGDENDREIVRTIVSMGRTLNKTLIAEGVETEEQRRILEEIGEMFYQGYLFGRPGEAGAIP